MDTQKIKEYIINATNNILESKGSYLRKTPEEVLTLGTCPYNEDFIAVLSNGDYIYPGVSLKSILEEIESMDCTCGNCTENLLDYISEMIFDSALDIKTTRDKVVADFEQLKDSVYITILEGDAYPNLKDMILMREFIDTNISCSCMYEKTEEGGMALRLDQMILKDLNMSADEMFELALNNTKEHLGELLFVNKKESIKMTFEEMFVSVLPEEIVKDYLSIFSEKELSEMEKIWEVMSKGVPEGNVLYFPETLAHTAESENNDLYVVSLDFNENSDLYLVVSGNIVDGTKEGVVDLLFRQKYIESKEKQSDCKFYKYSLQDKTIAVI